MWKCALRSVVIATFFLCYGLQAQVTALPYSKGELPTLQQRAQHGVESQRITAYFTRLHYKRVTLDRAMSKAIFHRYFELLDGRHWIFLKSDLKEFAKYQNTFDDTLEAGRLGSAYAIYNFYLRRYYERLSYALSLLDTPLPLNTPIADFEIDREKSAWPDTVEQLNRLWYKRVRLDELNLTLAGKKWPDIQKTLKKRYISSLKRLKKTDSEDVFLTLMTAFASSIDPHTSYFSPSIAEQFNTNMNLSLEGIGAVLQWEDDYTVIRSLVPGGPAARSKALKAEDRIIGVSQHCKGKPEDIVGWRLDDVVKLIKGPKDTVLCLQIERGNGAGLKTHQVRLVRDKIRLEDRAAKSEITTVDGVKIGFMQIPGFYVNLHKDVQKQLDKLTKKGMQALVVDLRNNGGGLLTEAIKLSGLFIVDGPIVQIRDGQNEVSVEQDADPSIDYKGPLVILINRGSASASEIFAAAMQDYGRAVIVGQDSFGKGTVQQYRELSRLYDFYPQPMGTIKYTISKFYRITGGSTQEKGVIPDIEFPAIIDPSKEGESGMDNALPWDRIKPLSHQPFNKLVSIIPKLRGHYLQQAKHDPEYQSLLKEITLYRQESEKNEISLIKKERLKERQQRESQLLVLTNARLKQEGKAVLKSIDDLTDQHQPDYYRQAAVQIAAELTHLENQHAAR